MRRGELGRVALNPFAAGDPQPAQLGLSSIFAAKPPLPTVKVQRMSSDELRVEPGFRTATL
jgi:hypothetical protein